MPIWHIIWIQCFPEFFLFMIVMAVVSAVVMPVGNGGYATVVIDNPTADNHVTVYFLNDSRILVFFGHSASSLFLFQCSVSSKSCQLFLYYVGSWRHWRRSYIAFFSFCSYCRRIVGILMYAITEHTYN